MTPTPHLRGEIVGKPLTRREMQVLATYAMTGDRALAASRLGISRYTLVNHLTRIYAKLDVQGAIDAFRAEGWLSVPREVAA